MAVAKLFKIKQEDIKKTVENFKGVDNRLELVRSYQGIKYYNDTTATTPDAVIAALNSFKEPIVLLAGGTDKKLDYKNLAQEIKAKARAVIVFEGSGTAKLVKELKKINFNKTLVFVDSINEAFKQAQYILDKGDVFLLSPGAASFGMFKNEYDRGDQFIKQVEKLK
jgi:UDP-N-acetylmuramoylalanine--D-glutamate ligase